MLVCFIVAIFTLRRRVSFVTLGRRGDTIYFDLYSAKRCLIHRIKKRVLSLLILGNLYRMFSNVYNSSGSSTGGATIPPPPVVTSSINYQETNSFLSYSTRSVFPISPTTINSTSHLLSKYETFEHFG